MRRFLKRQILDIFTCLHTLHKESRIRLEQHDYAAVQTDLSDCQAAAVQIGEAIERIKGEGTKAVARLEQYCETAYQVSIQLTEIAPYKAYKMLEEDLIKAENEVKHMPTELEVVFLPYKSSMWDSLESIWMAAKEDSGCASYVIPIPYYDRQPDGSFGRMHWEGEDFPEHVPVTPYDAYDFAGRHPDIIFIHNPYDGNNYVTSVHPDFYAEKLKQYTDELVYVPYYILPAPPEEKDEGFALTSGVFHSDYVFVQNDEVREFYIRTLCKYIPEIDPVCWKNKIIAAGSPKTDRYVNARREDFDVPPEWRSVLEGRKAVFFNTNVSMILKNSDHIMENLNRIFEIFRRHPQFAVIWREHPLTMATLKSMRAGLMQEYLELRERFVKEHWGILDTTPDPHMAMALSDCYFGAGGSLSALYPVTGKPLLIMDYTYPEQISPEEITLEEMLSTASLRMLYAERNVNSLELFLTHLSVFEAQKEERISRQSVRMNNLDGTVGRKIYEYTKNS